VECNLVWNQTRDYKIARSRLLSEVWFQTKITRHEVQLPLHYIHFEFLKTGYSPCCACAILFVLVDYYLSFPWFPVRLRNIRAIPYLLIQGVGIHSFEEIFNDFIRFVTFMKWNPINNKSLKQYEKGERILPNKDAFKVCLFEIQSSPSPCRTYKGKYLFIAYIRLFRSPESRLDL
jgi:hypothetical protein